MVCFRQILYCKLFVITTFLLCSKWLWARLDNLLKLKVAFDIFEHLMVGNAFQGLFIYLLFALKKNEIKLLKTRVSNLFTEQTTLRSLNTDEKTANGTQTCNNNATEDSVNVLKP